MEFPKKEQKRIRQYLLGDLDEEQCQQLEERVFTSPDFKAQVLIVEDELAEDYVAGTLSTREKEAFRQRLLLTHEQNQRLNVISGLRAYAASQPPIPIASVGGEMQRPFGLKQFASLFRQPVPVLLTVLIILAAGFTFWFLSQPLKPGPNPQDLMRRQELEQQVSRLNPPGNQPLPSELTAPEAKLSYLTLTPDLLRGTSGQAKVEILGNITVLQLKLNPPFDQSDRYRVELRTGNGIELLRHDGLTRRTSDKAGTINFNLPSSAIPPNDYILRLSARNKMNQYEEVAEYFFRISLNTQ
jgi:hypothetical protein